MTGIAVVAHAGKTLGDGLLELRRELERLGYPDPVWHEVEKSKRAPKRIAAAVEAGADLIFVWGGDGMVQRSIDAVKKHPGVTLAILPAGTANLLATNLGIPKDLQAAVDIGLHGARRTLDVGSINGERFAVMAGCGFDALMIHDADKGLKDRLGRAAYVFTGAKNLRVNAVTARVKIDGHDWFSGNLGCLLVGNVGSVFGDVQLFDDARPDDGRLDVGIVTAEGVGQWTRALARAAFGKAEKSPLIRMTVARKIEVKLDKKTRYQLDGGDRPPTDRLKIKVHPAAVEIAVPHTAAL